MVLAGDLHGLIVGCCCCLCCSRDLATLALRLKPSRGRMNSAGRRKRVRRKAEEPILDLVSSNSGHKLSPLPHSFPLMS